MTIVRKRLLQANIFILQNWLVTNKDILTLHSYPDLAQKAGVELGFEIAPRSIASIAKILDMPAGFPRAVREIKVPTDTKPLEAQIAALKEDLITATKYVRYIMERLQLGQSKPLEEILLRHKGETK